MAQVLLQGRGCRFGTFAPPIDQSATQRLVTQQRRRCSPYGATEVLPTCAMAPFRRRTLSSSARGEASITSAGRAAKLYDLDREGAYVTSSPAPQAPSAIGDGDGDRAFLDDGWGVAAVGTSSAPSSAPPKPAAKQRDKKKLKRPQLQAAAAAVPGLAQRPVATPFFDKSSEAGLAGLTLLQVKLMEEGRVVHVPERKAATAAAAEARRERQAKTVRRKRDWVDPDDLEDEGEAEELSLKQGNQQQYFEVNLEADGSTEVVEFDTKGRVKARRAPGAGAAGSSSRRRGNMDDDDDPLAFLADIENDDDDEDVVVIGDAKEEDDDFGYGRRRVASGAAAGPRRGNLYDDGADDDGAEEDRIRRRRPMPGQDPLADEEIEWGLDEIRPVGRPSLLRELGVIKKKKTTSPKRDQQQQPHHQLQQEQQQRIPQGKQPQQPSALSGTKGKRGAAAAAAAAAASGKTGAAYNDSDEDEYDEDEEHDVSVSWGGSGGASGIDMEQQEALLARLFKPHKAKELMAHQRAAELELAALKRKTSGRQVLESKVHSRMRIIAGSAAGRQLASSQGATTRPMMEKVRQAIFSMIESQVGSENGLPVTSRWLDMFAGTGSVGLEALSRGCRECHFIELDPWVCRKVLSRNISSCGFQRQSVVHSMKAEDFLRKSIELPRFAGGPFDFLSVCPPYLVVSYPELMDLLERSPLLHPRSIVFVEYPKQLEHQVPQTLGSLITVRDRKYGRTYIRVYGPAEGPAGGASGSTEDRGNEDDEDGEELLL